MAENASIGVFARCSFTSLAVHKNPYFSKDHNGSNSLAILSVDEANWFACPQKEWTSSVCSKTWEFGYGLCDG